MKYKVSVEKMTRHTGFVLVDSKTADEATELVNMVNKRIANGDLQTSAVEWDDPEYEDGSFCTTGDVEYSLT